MACEHCGCDCEDDDLDINEELVEKLVRAIKRVYKHNDAGGCLHCIIDDGNFDGSDGCYELEHTEWCKGGAQKKAENACWKLLEDATEDDKQVACERAGEEMRLERKRA